jgi:hypothetical protein
MSVLSLRCRSSGFSAYGWAYVSIITLSDFLFWPKLLLLSFGVVQAKFKFILRGDAYKHFLKPRGLVTGLSI